MKVRLGDLPEDVQVLIGDFIECFDENVDFTVFEVPLERFPSGESTDLDPSRGPEHAAAMIDWNALPPVLLHGTAWLDGRHRVHAARAQGRQSVTAIDLGEHGATLAPGMEHSVLGRLRESRAACGVVNRLLEDDEFGDDALRDEIEATPSFLPVPDNLHHTDNLKHLEYLDYLNFEGPDASLEESLFEYGIAWADVGDEYIFIYNISDTLGDESRKRFDRADIAKNLNLETEYDWADFGEVAQMNGMAEFEWHALPLPHKIYDLYRMYGFESVFGSGYWEGFTITPLNAENEDDENA